MSTENEELMTGTTNQNIVDDSNEIDATLEDLLKEMKENVVESEVKPEQESEVLDSTISEETKLSPLEQMKQQTEEGSGMVLSNEELEQGKENREMKNIVYRDERINSWKQSIADMDETQKRRNSVTVIKQAMNQNDYIQMMLEIDSIKFDADDNPYFDYKDDNGNSIKPEFCRIRENKDEAFDFSGMDEKYTSSSSVVSDEDEETKTEELSDDMKNTVKILIDKTGLGTDFMFTDEEKQKITEADSIQIREVKLIDIAAIKEKRSTKSFQETINEYDLSGSRTTICFPASGFKAQMKGLTYGEYADISLSMDNVTFDQYRKRLSIIYNKMTNISTGPFKDFEDFLKNFAYTDIQLALYGLFVSTEAENQEIQLQCGKCKNTFNWKFDSRSVLRLERCAPTFLSDMKKVATADAMDFDQIKANSVVMNSKFIELPESKFICEMGIASAYDFLYNFIPLMDGDTFKDAFGDELNEVYMNNTLLLTSLRGVYVPNIDGTYTQCLGYKDILDATYNVSPKEIQIIAAYAAEIQGKYDMTFSFGDVDCPHCKHVTKNLDISMDDLVFQTYQRLMNTEIDLSKIQSL